MVDRCPIADAMTVLGGRWTGLVVRELNYGRRRFSEILTAMGAPRAEYHLTPVGEELGPPLIFLTAWGEKRGEHSDLTVDERRAGSRG